MDEELEPDRSLDCLGLYCPEPVFRTRLILDEMEAGEVLEVMADDPAADEDLRRLARRLGHEVVSRELHDGVLKILIRKTR